MTAIDNLLSASFRGVSFLAPDEKHMEGRKTVTHEYVNSSQRYVEDLGGFPSKFTLTAIVTNIEQRDLLRLALRTSGSGLLIHPVYGRQDVTVEGQYEVSTDNKSLGEYKFNITFVSASVTPIQPNPDQAQVSTIFFLDLALRRIVFSRLADQWIPPLTKASTTDTLSKINTFTNVIQKPALSITGDVSNFSKAINYLKKNAGNLIRSGSDLSEALNNAFFGIDDILGESFQVYKSLTNLFDFGSDDIEIKNTYGLSIDQHQRNINRGLLNTTVIVSSLSQAYTYATDIDYLTVNELSSTRQTLDKQTRDVIEKIRSIYLDFDAASASGIEISPAQSGDIILNLQNIRTKANDIFSEKELNIYRVGTFKSPLTSTRLLSYTLYESEDNSTLVENLNARLRPSGLQGDLSILAK